MTFNINDIFKNTAFKRPNFVNKWLSSNINVEKVPVLSAIYDNDMNDGEIMINRDEIKIKEPNQFGVLIMTEHSEGGNYMGGLAHTYYHSLEGRVDNEFETILLNIDEMGLSISDYIRIKRSMKKIEDVHISEYYGNGSTYTYFYFLDADIKYILDNIKTKGKS